MNGLSIGLAVYAAIVATFTLLLGYGRAWWRERYPLKVRVARESVATYVAQPDAEGNIIGRLRDGSLDMVTLSAVNLTDTSVRVVGAGFYLPHPLRRRLKREPRRWANMSWPVMTGDLPADLEPRRRWTYSFRWQDSTQDLTGRVRVWVQLDDGRRSSSRRRRLREPFGLTAEVYR